MNVRLPRVRRRDISRRFEFLRRSCHAVIVRCGILTLMTLALILLRCFCLRYTFPKFAPQENPVAAHESFYTRVSFYIRVIFIYFNRCV